MKCALPGCNNPTKNWRTHFCSTSHAGKYSCSKLPKLESLILGVRIKRFPNGTRNPKSTYPYKDRTSEQKGKWVAYIVARQKRIKKATPIWADLDAIKEFYIEAQRLTKETGIPHEVDHIIPISKGGLHHQNNLQVITRTENRVKGNKII